MGKNKLKIGEFSRLGRVTVRALRHYEEIGLLVPEIVDRDTGYRYYAVGAHLYLPVPNTLMILQGKNLIPISKQVITLTVTTSGKNANDSSGKPDCSSCFVRHKNISYICEKYL